MSVQSAAASPHQETLQDFVLVRTDEIDEGDRLRQVDPVWAEALGQMMARDGQDTPIQICRLPGQSRWTLVAGAHRRAGAIKSEIEYLRAEIVSAGRDDRRMREARENVMRSDLSPVERAAHIAEIVAVMKRRAGIDPAADGRAGSAAARWQKAVKAEAADTTATITVVYGITEAVAAEVGFSARTVENDLMLYRRLAPSLVERLRDARHPIYRNGTQLRALAKLDAEAQRLAVDRLIAGAKNVAEATRPIGGNRPADPEAKRLSAFIGAFSRMGVAEKKAALFQLAGMLPAGMSLTTVEPEQVVAANDDLHEIITAIDDYILDEHDPDWVVGEVIGRFGGRARSFNGSHELQTGGIAASFGTGGHGLLKAWQRAARKHILGLRSAAR